jgi:membrane-associated protease RseP (regulator of RpoE activity)
MLPSSINFLRSVSKFVLQIVPPVLATVIGTYLVSAYNLGTNHASESRVVVQQEATPLPSGGATAVIAAGHEAARPAVAAKPTFEPRQRDVAAAEPETIAEPLVSVAPRRVKAVRETTQAKPATTVVAVADQAAPLPPPIQIADATVAQPVAEPVQSRVLGVPVPRFVARTSEKVANVADAMRPSRLISASWNFGKHAAGTVASAASAIVPETQR